MSGRVSAVILASGLSRRMGGMNKLLLRTGPGGVTLAEQTILTLREARGIDEILLVTGHDRVAAIGKMRGVIVVRNAHPERGVCESIRLGAQWAAGDYLLFCAADQPFLDRATIETVLSAAAPGRIVRPCCEGVAGNPVLFCSSLRDELLALRGDTGGREVIARHPGAVVCVETFNKKALADIDTASDYTELFPQV